MYGLLTGRLAIPAQATDGGGDDDESAGEDLPSRLEAAVAEEERLRAAGTRLEEEGQLLRSWAAATLYGGGSGGNSTGNGQLQHFAPPVGLSDVAAALDFVRARRAALDDELALVRKVRGERIESQARAKRTSFGCRYYCWALALCPPLLALKAVSHRFPRSRGAGAQEGRGVRHSPAHKADRVRGARTGS